MTMTTYFAPALELRTDNPFFEMFSKIGNVYTESMQVNTEQLWTSSARIIQEHTLRAMINASQGCMEALAQNATAIQQQSMGRLGDANQKAFQIMSSAFSDAMKAGFKPAP